jgi:hypothetical protein
VTDELKPCEWRAIPGFEGIYDVSTDGRVRSWYTGGGFRLVKPRERTLQRDKDGYPFVLLYRGGKAKGFRVSALVLMAFRGPRPPAGEASHRDGNKVNNAANNLIWESRIDNEKRKEQHGTRPRGSGNHASKLTEDSVQSIRARRTAGEKLLSLAQEYGVTESEVSAICKRKVWTHV